VNIFLIIQLVEKLPSAEIPTYDVLFTRFACSFALHMFMRPEWVSGLNNMKLVINHPYRFSNQVEPFVIGLLQVVAAAMIEAANVLQLITNTEVIEVVMNFMALAILAEFDDFFFSA
jgi:hypothetical protein